MGPVIRAAHDLYQCMITLKLDAQALAFAAASEKWFGILKSDSLIGDRRLYRPLRRDFHM